MSFWDLCNYTILQIVFTRDTLCEEDMVVHMVCDKQEPSMNLTEGEQDVAVVVDITICI